MNAAINSDVLDQVISENVLDLPGQERVYHHPTFLKVVNELEAPKSHDSDYGGYKYRSAEDIQAALKPLLLKYKCTVFTREFEIKDGFKVYAYIVFKDQKYIRCDLPGVAVFDFVKDLEKNKKISKTQQFAAYQSYAKKYALCNLLLIDDSQNDLDALTNQNIQNEQQSKNNKNYNNQRNSYVPTQADCDKALKQIDELPLSTPLTQAEYFFDGIRNQLPEFDEVLFAACDKKYGEIMQYLQSLSQQQSSNTEQLQEQQSKPHQTNNRSGGTAKINPDAASITDKQLVELRAFISERALNVKQVCEHLGIDGLAQISISKFEEAKQHIDQLAKQELHA